MSGVFYHATARRLISVRHYNSIIPFHLPPCGFSSLAYQTNQLCTKNPPTQDFSSLKYSTILQNCIQNDDPLAGMSIHCEIFKKGNCLDLFASNILLNFYVKSGLLDEALNLFDELSVRNTVSFVTLINGYAQVFRLSEAAELFTRLHREGHELNPFVFTTFLKMIVSVERADLCSIVHACILKLGHNSDAFVGTALIDAYSVCGQFNEARKVFEGIMDKDMVSWTGMVTCFAENERFADALECFSQMRMLGFKPNNYTFASVLKACVGMNAPKQGQSIQGCILKMCNELDVYVGTALLELYTKFGDIDDAHKVFDEIPNKDVIYWSFMISRHAQSDHSRMAVEMFCRMRQAYVLPNNFTFGSMLQACASLESIELGKQIHSLVVKFGLDSSLFVSNALMDVYAKCGKIDISVEIFEELQTKNEVTWNTLIVGHVQSGDAKKAMDLFLDMLQCEIWPSEVTYSSILRASAALTALEPANQIHSLAIKTTYDKHNVVANSLIDTYAKCGTIRDSRLVFDKMGTRDEVSWNAMISGYSSHGLGREALKVFEMMKDGDCQPNKLTFVGVLSACSNTGLLEEGQAYFKSMVEDFGIEPCMEHYTCMVWLWGRLGQLDKAMKLIGQMPMEPSIMVWRALLGACVIHHDVELGRMSAECVLQMDPQDEATYVLLSNIYANARQWENVACVRKKMKKRGVKKEPGLSWLEFRGTVHYFTVGDTSHPDMKLISAMLEWLNMKSRKEGFIPNCTSVLLHVEDEEKERMLWLHSERLALAFALIKLPHENSIRIVKNLRICMDCHAVVKLITKIVQREIIIRDMNRYHHFRDGECSCGDYW